MNEQKKVSGTSRDFLQFLFYALFGAMLVVSIPYNLAMFTNIFILIVVFVLSQIMHEGGHYLSHWMNKRNPKATFNRVGLPVMVSAFDNEEKPFASWELTRASVFGIVAGVIPLNFYFYGTGNFFGVLVLQVFYIYASRFDIMDVRNSVRDYLHNFYIDSKRSKEGL
jgi:hypothetical protein